MTDVRTVSIGSATFGSGDLGLIAGPCVIEETDVCKQVAEQLVDLRDRLSIPVVFKASYDKANRTSKSSFRGPGIDEGLKVLSGIKEQFGLPVLSDVHDVSEVASASEVLDVLQIPAFLCRQTDLLVAASESGKPVNVKKGQFLAPWDMEHVVGKCEGAAGVMLTERGTSFGYNNLVSDFRSLPTLRSFGWPVIYDGTHSVQLPGGAGGASSGQREMIPHLCRAAVAVGVDGLFLETHPNPDQAKSDGPNMVPLAELEALISRCLKIHAAVS